MLPELCSVVLNGGSILKTIIVLRLLLCTQNNNFLEKGTPVHLLAGGGCTAYCAPRRIGDIYGKAFVRDAAGNIVYETEGDYKGLPLVEGDGNTVKVGNANPVFMMGWDHTFSYKGFSLYFLLDWRYGGKVLSQTQAEMDLYGVSEITADARDRGYVMLEGQQIDNVKGFYKNVVGGRAGVTEYYMYDATNLRLREVSLSYNFSKKWIQKTKVLKDVQLSFVARNLCFLYKKAPFDPDLVLSTGNDNQGIEVFGMPTTRSLGFTLKCEF